MIGSALGHNCARCAAIVGLISGYNQAVGTAVGIFRTNRVSSGEEKTSSVPPCAFAISEAI